jgi:ABC-2 type transport system ATP-binding protein
MVREGRLDDLIAVENETELVLADASPELLAQIRTLIENKGGGAKIVRSGHSRTTLERLFLDATEETK